MNPSNIAAIKDIFEKNKIKLGRTKFLLYIHAVIADFVFHDDDAYFKSYREAWESKRAASYKKYLPEQIKREHEDVIFGLCDCIADSTGDDFISQIAPELFPCDISCLFSYFKVGSRRNFIYDLIKLYALLGYNAFLQTTSYGASPSRLSKDELLASFENRLTEWSGYELYKGIYGLFDDIQKLWVLSFGALYSPSKVRATGIAGILRDLSSLGLTNEEALELFYVVKVQNVFKNLKSIDDPYSYFRAVFLKRKNSDSDWVKETGQELISPGQSFFIKEELFNKILSKWSKLDTIDFVKAICYPKYSHNFCVETAIATPSLLQYCARFNRTLIIDANPDLILKVAETDTKNKVCFVMSSKTLAALYKQRFEECNFAYIEKNEDKELSFFSINIDDSHYGKEMRFKKVPLDIAAAALVFARNDSEDLLGETVDSLTEFFKKEGEVILFCPNSLFDAKDRRLRNKLLKKYNCCWIFLLPTETSSAWLKKNMIVCLSTFRQNETLSIFRSGVYENVFGEQVICRDPWPVVVPHQDFVDSTKTVNQIWEQFRPKKTSDNKRKTRRWIFSKEISLWYSWSKKRGKVQYYGTPNEKQLRVNPLARGKRLTPYHPYTSHSIEQAEEKFETLIWEPEFWPIISEEIKNAYKYRPISLKTFWFCNENDLRMKAGYNHSVAKKLFQSEMLAELMSNDEQDFEFFNSIINAYQADKNAEILDAWRTLNAIISLANQSGRFMPNTISDHVLLLKERDKRLQKVRKGLAKRSFEREEELSMLKKLQENLPNDGAFVGAAISFYTGIPLSQICALNWGDYHNLLGQTSLYQLWVTKAVVANGTIKNFDKDDKNMFRRVPVVKQLAVILNERFEFVKKEFEEAGESVAFTEMSELPIVSKNDLKSRCIAADVRKVQNVLELAAGIEPMEVSVERAGAKVTDLNEYSGDRFRTNFYYRALNTCCMSRAEANYIYGISLPTTFSKHYCDYTNDFAQLMLCGKLERWTCLHQRIEHNEGIFEGNIPTTGKQIHTKANMFLRSSVELRMKVKPEWVDDYSDEAVISISDSRGVNVAVRKRECKK